jgi:hypothetical protein
MSPGPDPVLARRAFIIGTVLSLLFAPTLIGAQAVTGQFSYTFNSAGTLYEAPNASESTSPYLWLKSGGMLTIDGTYGQTIQYALPSSDPLYARYANNAWTTSDGGAHPQNSFFLLSKMQAKNVGVSVYFDRVRDNLNNVANQHPYNAEPVIARYQNDNNYYMASIRADGQVTIKKDIGGAYTTLAAKKIFPGTYGPSDLSLIPHERWIGLKLEVIDTDAGPQLTLYTDYGWTGTWKQWLTVLDDPSRFGPGISASGNVGVESDFADMIMDNLYLHSYDTSASATQAVATTNYDTTVLAAKPALYLAMSTPSSRVERDLTGNGHSGTYQGGTPTLIAMPNGDKAAHFNGGGQYLSVPSDPTLSISHVGQLTWEGWVRADTLTFPNTTSSGYVDWMGKCENYSPNCEWEARFYSTDTTENRPSRFSAYVFNSTAGLGSGADWQPSSGQLSADQWIYVVAEYQTNSTPSACPSGTSGTISIWVDAVQQSFADHAPTGCMSQYQVTPQAGDSPLDIGTMALDSWFPGAIGKVAVYDRLLSQSEIDSHFKAMTGIAPGGSCGVTCMLTSSVKTLLSQAL